MSNLIEKIRILLIKFEILSLAELKIINEKISINIFCKFESKPTGYKNLNK